MGFTNPYYLYVLWKIYTVSNPNMNTREFWRRLYFIFLWEKRDKISLEKRFVSPFLPPFLNMGPFKTVVKPFFDELWKQALLPDGERKSY